MSKYIIDVGDAYVRHALGRKLIIPVIINNDTEYWVNTNIQLTPCTEPDMEKIREVREEAYQEGYRRALADVREEHVCQTCVYFEQDENEEPCVRCPRNFLDQYTPKQEQEAIQVGDEVRNIENRWIAVVCNIEGECMTLMDTNGALGDGYKVNRFIKTGRHFPEIAAVLAKMKEES